MLKNRHFISYFSTTLMYLLLGGFFFYAQKHTLISTQKFDEKILNMALSAFIPEVIPPVEEVVREEEPEIIKEPLTQEEPKMKEEQVIEPIVEKTIPKPIVQKKKKVKKKIKKKRLKKKKVSQKTSAQRSKAEKNQFLANIRAKINKNKSYPRVAKKRRMQGSVKVKFTILRSGEVGNIFVFGPKVFHSSAKKAVKKAFPIKTQNAPLSLPTQINITLRYQIR